MMIYLLITNSCSKMRAMMNQLDSISTTILTLVLKFLN
uniref:Uncharacterized protein n=1 Tax=Arundo donax TaxID=35708 RepID=A0A0A9ERV5_ARUDO